MNFELFHPAIREEIRALAEAARLAGIPVLVMVSQPGLENPADGSVMFQCQNTPVPSRAGKMMIPFIYALTEMGRDIEKASENRRHERGFGE